MQTVNSVKKHPAMLYFYAALRTLHEYSPPQLQTVTRLPISWKYGVQHKQDKPTVHTTITANSAVTETAIVGTASPAPIYAKIQKASTKQR